MTLKSYRAHSTQAIYHRSKAQTRVIKAPARSGKTYCLSMEAIKDGVNIAPGEAYPLPSILLGAPTYAQTKSLLFDPIKSILSDMGYLRGGTASPGSMQLELRNGRMMYFRSLSATAQESVRGLTVKSSFLDEVALMPEEAIDIVRGRMVTTNGRLTVASTPKGKNNHFYSRFFDPAQPKQPSTDIIEFSIYDNPAVSYDYIESLQEIYSPAFFKQEVLGDFVSLAENRVYYAFDENVNVGTVTMPLPYERNKYRWFVGVDYNVGKNATIFGFMRGGEIYIYKEIYGLLSTQELIPAVKATLPDASLVRVYDDSNSGHSRNQLTGQTNRDLWRKAGISTHTRTSNPPVMERIDRVNALLYNKKFIIDKSCINLIRELNDLEYKKDTLVPNDQGGKAGHITDALGYALFELNPVAHAVSRPVIYS